MDREEPGLQKRKEEDVGVPALEIRGLTGGYSLRRPVLHDLTFRIGRGEWVGLIGLNGAGKSTAIKHILGLMTPQAGEVRVNGVRLEDDRERYRSSCAYVPEQPNLYAHLTVGEHLRWTAMAYGIERDAAEERIGQLAGEFRMTEALGALPDTLSKGMKQKTMLMNALLVCPPLLIIDEPFLGLDPLATRGLIEALSSAQAAGCAILLSSHLLPALERRADRLIVLHRGRTIAEGTPAEVKAAAEIRSGNGAAIGTLDDAFEALVVAAEAGGGPSNGL